MEFRRSATGDQRRRRVLIEEKLNVVGVPDHPPTSERVPAVSAVCRKSYTDAALLGHQPTTIIVLAQRSWAILVAVLVGLTAIVGLEAAFGQIQLMPRAVWPGRLPALEIESPGSLAAWLSSLLLTVAAFQGLQIFRIRRHKVDDYRGRYRVWGWASPVIFIMAIAAGTGFHVDLVEVLGTWTGRASGSEHASTASLLTCLVWIPIALRLTFEVRRNRTAFWLLVATIGCYLTAAILSLAQIDFTGQIVLIMVRSFAAMLGHLAIFATLAVYGRHVYLDSQGLLPARQPTRRRSSKSRKTPTFAAKEPPEVQVEPAPQERPPVPTIRVEPPEEVHQEVISLQTARKASSDVEPQEEAEEPEDQDDGGAENMSRAERRRLRKQKRHEQHRRAA
jgi:hypothetical protein